MPAHKKKTQRQKFEEWANKEFPNRDLRRYQRNEFDYESPGQYRDSIVDVAWKAWNRSSQVNRIRKSFAPRGSVNFRKKTMSKLDSASPEQTKKK